MYLEYTIYMSGVDVADQLRASCSCQIRSHKWWHRVFWFFLDQTVANMYIYYLAIFDRQLYRGQQREVPMNHLQFKTNFCQALTMNWRGRVDEMVEDLEVEPKIHVPWWSQQRWQCVLCHNFRSHFFCFKCGTKYFCLKAGCFELYHNQLRRHH